MRFTVMDYSQQVFDAFYKKKSHQVCDTNSAVHGTLEKK